MNNFGKTRRSVGVATILAITVAARTAMAVPLPTPITTINVPPQSGNGFSTALRYGPDGLIYAWDGAQVWKQNGVNVNGFTSIGAISTAGSDSGPLNFSQNGGTLLISDGAGGLDSSSNGLLFTMPAAGSATAITSPVGTEPFNVDLQAVPAASMIAGSSTKFFVDRGFDSSGTSSAVDVFDDVTGAAKTVVQNVPGASASIAFDSGNRLYVGVGFGPDQGQIRSFSLSSLDEAFTDNSPKDWLKDGQLYNSADNNSGSGMFIDARGLMFVGGPNGLTVLDGAGDSRLYDTGSFSFPTVMYNSTNDQFALYTFGADPSIFDAAQFGVPEPSTIVLAAAGAVLFCGWSWRRRKNMR